MRLPLSRFTTTKNRKVTTTKPLHILYIGNRLSVHGSTPTNIETLGPRLEQEGYKVYYASSKLNTVSRFTDMLLHIIQHARQANVVLIDTYSTSAFYFAWASALMCKALRLPYIPILHGGNLPDRIDNSPVLTRQLLGNSYTNIVISGYLQHCLDKKGFKNQLIPNNIDLSEYPFLHRAHVAPKLLWVRAFHKTYNPQLAIKVLHALLRQYPGAMLTMVGPEKDGSMAQCKALAQQLGVSDQVRFTGRLDKKEWIALSQSCDIFINTTNFDNLPVSLIEAMALGFPVVTTNVGGIPFLIDDDMNGILVMPDDPVAMVAAITGLLEDNNKAASVSLAARKKVEMFDWQTIKKKWHALFSSMSN